MRPEMYFAIGHRLFGLWAEIWIIHTKRIQSRCEILLGLHTLIRSSKNKRIRTNIRRTMDNWNLLTHFSWFFVFLNKSFLYLRIFFSNPFWNSMYFHSFRACLLTLRRIYSDLIIRQLCLNFTNLTRDLIDLIYKYVKFVLMSIKALELDFKPSRIHLWLRRPILLGPFLWNCLPS
jgi:hypothetical protein